MTASTKRNKPYIIGVAGGSGSGKTYFARAVQRALGRENCEIVLQDNFYFDQSKNFDFDGGSVNFDHPDAIDFALLAECLTELRAGGPTDIPLYDFVSHSRAARSLRVQPKPIIIVDGILIFHSEPLRGLFHERVFFETPEELRFQRRLDRDVQERGRTAEGVHNQFYKQVKPMHDAFVEPSKAFATAIVRDQGEFQEALNGIVARLQELI